MAWKDAEKRRIAARAAYQRRKDYHREWRKEYYARNKEALREYGREYRRQLKAQACEAYGGAVCACCGEAHMEFLTIDHIGGGGKVHRRQPGVGASHFYWWLKHEGYPEGFRVLCMNCNFSLGHWGYCPHGNVKNVPNPMLQVNRWIPTQDSLRSSDVSLHMGRVVGRDAYQLSLEGIADTFGDGS